MTPDDRHVPRYSSVAKRYASVKGDRYEIDVQLAWGYERVQGLFRAIVKRAIRCPGMDIVVCSGLVRFAVKRLGTDAEFTYDPSDDTGDEDDQDGPCPDCTYVDPSLLMLVDVTDAGEHRRCGTCGRDVVVRHKEN